jgi:LmbE family N-acetylglucosaminyl deacetylase
MNAICVVAHPDDCVIFAYSFIHNHPEYKWTICYLTYTDWSDRGCELANFWQRRNIPCIFLGYVDDYHDIENKQISFNVEQADREIKNIIKGYTLVLTHDNEGDYGHLHHAFVNQATLDHPHRVTFAGPGQGTVKYSIEPGVYTLDELPMHRDIIASFHPKTHTNEYTL